VRAALERSEAFAAFNAADKAKDAAAGKTSALFQHEGSEGNGGLKLLKT
jgi:hypothetical protein